jgi:hypothetical protein
MGVSAPAYREGDGTAYEIGEGKQDLKVVLGVCHGQADHVIR